MKAAIGIVDKLFACASEGIGGTVHPFGHKIAEALPMDDHVEESFKELVAPIVLKGNAGLLFAEDACLLAPLKPMDDGIDFVAVDATAVEEAYDLYIVLRVCAVEVTAGPAEAGYPAARI